MTVPCLGFQRRRGGVKWNSCKNRQLFATSKGLYLGKLSGFLLLLTQKMERKVLAVGKSLFRPHHLFAVWWFQTFFIFHNIWALYGNNHTNWRILFRGVETTNQSSFVWGFMLHGVPRFVTWHTQLTGHRGALCRARLYQQKLGSSRGGSNAGGEEFWVTEKQLNESYDHLPKINISYLCIYIYIYIIFILYDIYIYNYIYMCVWNAGRKCMYLHVHKSAHRITQGHL